jgi:hypothetical protein
MMMSLCFSRDEEEDDLDAKRVVFAPVKRAAATAAAAFNGGGTSRVRIKDVMVVGVQNVLCSSRRCENL